MTQNRIEGKFYPLTPETGKKLRDANLTASEWRIWSYLVELDPFGDRYVEFETLKVIQECDCSKSTFYKALGRFQSLEFFDFQDQGIFARNLAIPKFRKVVREIGLESEISESCPRNRKAVREIGLESEISENRVSKTLPEEASRSPQTIQTYIDFKDSLSDNEREKFLDFVRKEIKSFSRPISDLETWLASQTKAGENRWFVYYEKFKEREERALSRPSLSQEIEERRQRILAKKRVESQAKAESPNA